MIKIEKVENNIDLITLKNDELELLFLIMDVHLLKC